MFLPVFKPDKDLLFRTASRLYGRGGIPDDQAAAGVTETTLQLPTMHTSDRYDIKFIDASRQMTREHNKVNVLNFRSQC